MESIYTELALYGSKNDCARTDNVYFPISEVCNGTILLNKGCKIAEHKKRQILQGSGGYTKRIRRLYNKDQGVIQQGSRGYVFRLDYRASPEYFAYKVCKTAPASLCLIDLKKALNFNYNFCERVSLL